MSFAPQPLARRAGVLLALVAAVAVAAALLLSGPASAASTAYPAPVRKAFLKTCTSSAAKSGVSRGQAGAYCEAALECIESKLTLSGFVKVKATNPIVTNCETKAAKQTLG